MPTFDIQAAVCVDVPFCDAYTVQVVYLFKRDGLCVHEGGSLFPPSLSFPLFLRSFGVDMMS